MASHPTIDFRLEESDGNVHLSDTHREHDTDTLDCWCGPTLYRVCMECEDGCWRCADGRHELSRDDAAWCDDPLLIVHR